MPFYPSVEGFPFDRVWMRAGIDVFDSKHALLDAPYPILEVQKAIPGRIMEAKDDGDFVLISLSRGLMEKVFEREAQTKIDDPDARISFIGHVDAGFQEALQSESTLHGIRVEILFELMVANIDKVQLLKREDSGDCYYAGDPLAIPDFRVITETGSSLLIEVKNYYTTNVMRPFRIRNNYLEALKRYAAKVGVDLRITIYWARLNLWTLNDPLRFRQVGGHSVVFRASQSLPKR